MPTRNIVLTEHQARFVEELVESGKYQDASEVLREGLRLVERRESEDHLRLRLLREAAKKGLADFETGAFNSFGTAEELADYLSEMNSQVFSAK